MVKVFSRIILPAVLFSLVSTSLAQNNSEAVRDITEIQVNERQLREAVASRTLTWLTGGSSNNDYISVGRTANFFGFVALRVASGQSLSRSAVAKDTLAILNPSQLEALTVILNEQKKPFQRTSSARYEMNRALEGLLINEPLSHTTFLELGREYGAAEAELGRVIGQRFGEIAQTLSPSQMDALANIRALHVSGQGQTIDRQGLKLKLSKDDKKELVNLAARFLSWTTGSTEFNDFEVVGKPSQHFGFVSLRIESNHGVRRGDIAKEVLAMLSPEQQQILSSAAEHDVNAFKTFLQKRAGLMRAIEVALENETIDSELISQLGSAVGEVEASMTWSQATAMLQVRDSLSDEQSSELLAMRAKYTATAQDSLPSEPVERGRQLYAQCVLCHGSTAANAIAPTLTGIVGRDIASDDTFEGYSQALKNYAELEGVWSEVLLDRFLTSPKSAVPGTYMSFDGLDEEQNRVAIIDFLKSDH